MPTDKDKPVVVRMTAEMRRNITKSCKATNTSNAGFLRAVTAFGTEATLSGRAEIVNGKLQLKAS